MTIIGATLQVNKIKIKIKNKTFSTGQTSLFSGQEALVVFAQKLLPYSMPRGSRN